MKHIVVIGGGISGMTAAHELIEQNYKVTLIERNDQVGGLARTYQNESDKTCPYEYSWRAYGKWYQNVYDIMKRIPFDNTETVFNKLVILQGGNKTCSKKIPEYQNTFSKLSFEDYIKILPTLLKYSFSCDERNRDNLSKIGLRDYIHEQKLSKEAENKIGKIVGPYFGFDYHHASLYDLLYCGEVMSENSSKENNFNITSLPTNYVWFEPWIRLLQSKGVELLLNTELIKINMSKSGIGDEIESIVVSEKKNFNGQSKIIKADYYINCTGPEILQKILEPYKLYKNIELFYNDIEKVARNGRQIQLSVYYYLNKKIFLENENTLAYLPNTPWLLMVLPTGHIWGDEHMEKFCKKEIKEVISVGICEPYVKGLLIKKPWSECTREEIEIEAWHQLINDSDFKNNICVEDNLSIDELTIIDFKMWDSFIYKDGKIDTYEPKWANNINTIQYRPTAITPISNLFVAGAYTNTSTGVFSMESATESGKVAAKTICDIDDKKTNIYLNKKKKNIFTYPIRHIDSLLYKEKYIELLILIITFVLFVFISYYVLIKFKLLKYIKYLYKKYFIVT